MTKKQKIVQQEPDRPEPEDPEPEKPAADIVGTWIRQEPDAAPYPDEITFDPDGIYSGKKAFGSRVASKLDSGVFDRIDKTSIRMSTATDRDETFALDVSEDDLKLVDEDGKELSYKRKSEDYMSADVAPSDSESASTTASDVVDATDDAPASGSSNEEWMP
ncbi:MAG: hypothetical protein K0S97_1384 [Chloroflexota bacterium]|jgi:hypothetical protein|nr:hypothetical protein [Chloroflexota bacterium]